MFQDRCGFMWFGTVTGLNRFDGYSFKSYKHNPRDSTTISRPIVFNIYEDRKGRLWIATYEGLDVYDRVTDSFKHFKRDGTISGSVSYFEAVQICEDARGNFWIGTTEGVLRWDEESGATTWYRHDPNDSTSISQRNVVSLLLDRSGRMWVSTRNGLNKYDSVNNRFMRYVYHKSRDSSTYNFSTILFEDSKGNIWFTDTTDGVLWRRDDKNDRFDRYAHDPANPNSIGNTIITAVSEDMYGRVWVWHNNSPLDIFDSASGGFIHALPNASDPTPIEGNSLLYRDKAGGMWRTYGGLERFDPNKQKFLLYRNIPNAKNSLGSNEVTSIIEDKAGIVWIGTDRGLDRFDRKTNTFAHYRHDSKNPNSLSGDNVNAVYEDRRGALWIACDDIKGGTLDMLDRKANRFIHYPYRNVRTIFEDSDGELWLGFVDDRDKFPDLIRLDADRNHVETYTIRGNGVTNIYQDHEGYLWMGAPFSETKRFDKKTNRFKYFEKNTDATVNIGSVRATYEDSEGILWFATNEGGLLRYDRKTNEHTRIMDVDGLPTNILRGFLQDDKGNFWISTTKGLSRYNPTTNTIRNFTEEDGLQGLYFHSRAYFKGNGGEMYFGGNNGLNIFHPDSIKGNPYIPPVVITSFKIFDEEQRPGGLADVKEIQLSYNQNHFSFEFAALNYTDPKRNQHAYKMEGVDKDWVQSGTRRFTSYTNLDPGTYTFRVKGSNNDGVWNEAGTSLTLIITPPWWRTTWAYGLYVGLIGAALYGMRRFELNRERVKLQMEIQNIEATRLKEVDQMKSRFFANISHEFRTPLTLILGPIEKLLNSEPFDSAQGKLRGTEWSEVKNIGSSVAPLPQNVINDLSMMHRNARRLLRLINQLLDLSKIEAGGMKLQAAPGNIVSFVKGIAQSFESSAGRRKITLHIETESNEIELYFDRDKMETILTNLLSNAFKFTGEGGTVAVSVRLRRDVQLNVLTEGECLEVSVRDTGIGIPSDQLDKVFDRFYQVDASQTREQEGSGIGTSR